MKKIFSFLLIFCMLFTSIASAAGIGGEKRSELEEYAYKKVGFMLNLANEDQKSYGLGNVAISNLKMGKMIPCHEKNGNDLVASKNAAYFPIVNDGQVILIMTVMRNSDNSLQAYLGQDFAKDLNSVYKNGNFALFSEDDTLSLVTKEKTQMVYGFKQKNKVKYSDFKLPEKSIETTFEGTKMEETALTITSLTSSMSKKLDVPDKKQPTNYTCWVTSAASIIEYKKGGTVDPYSLSKSLGVNPDTTYGSIDNVKSAFTKYSMSSIDKTNWSSAPVSDGFIITKIDDGIPLVGGFHDGATAGHMVAIDGYGISVSEGSILKIMDPWYGADRMVTYDSSKNNFTYNTKPLVTVIYPY